MVDIKYISSADLNGQALAWCNKVNSKVHATTNEIPFERLKAEGLNPIKREYIIDKINLRRVQKGCLISYTGNQYSVPAEHLGKDVVFLNNYLCTLLTYDRKSTADITRTFAPHTGELKAACDSYTNVFKFLCSASDIP